MLDNIISMLLYKQILSETTLKTNSKAMLFENFSNRKPNSRQTPK